MARIRIVSDGTPQGTRVLDSEGNVLPGVTSFKVMGSVSLDQILAVIELDGVEVDITAETDG